MEFRYTAMDGDRPSTTTGTASSHPPNSSFPFFPARPILGCNIGPSEDHVREAIQREIEKEQIRQEIIIAESSRRRELIAEVLQEMAVERELAIRKVAEMKGMSIDEKQTMLINQRNLQNQNQNIFGQMYTGPESLVTSPMMLQMPETTPVLEPKKDKLIMLKRVDPIGAKRKTEDTQIGVERAKKRITGSVGLAREEWSCTLMKEHLLEKEVALKANKTGEIGEIVSLNLPCLDKLASGKKQVERNPKRKFTLWCNVCNVGTYTQTVMRDHELGKKHIAALKQKNELKENPTSATSQSSETIAVLQNGNVKDEKVAAKETGKKTKGEKKKKKKKVIIRCEICNIHTYSEQVMETHKLGKRHKALLEKKQHKPLYV